MATAIAPKNPANPTIFYADFLFSVIGVLLGVAFFTLMERKVMGLAHYRKGPNKVVLWGISQPIADALKLLTKEFPKMSSYKMLIFYSGPSLSILLMLLCWGWYDFKFRCNPTSLKVIVILAIIRLTAYGFLLTRWGSNSKYSLLGGHRAVAQIISYEVCLVLFLLVAVYSSKTYNLQVMKTIQENMWVRAFCLPLFLV